MAQLSEFESYKNKAQVVLTVLRTWDNIKINISVWMASELVS